MQKERIDPFNTGYFVALMLVLLIPTLPAILTWFEILSR